MKKIKNVFALSVLLFCISQLASAQKEVPIDTTKRYVVVLDDATRLIGKVKKETKTEIIFVDDNLGIYTLSRKRIKSLEPEYGNELWVFTLSDGSIVTGKIKDKNDSITRIETTNLGNVVIANKRIVKQVEYGEGSVSQEGKFWFKNPNCTRYLFAPSAIPLKKGEGYYHNFYGAGNAVNYGITDYFSIGGGVAGPTGAFITPKLGFKITNYLHAGAGLLLGNSFFPINDKNFGLGIGYGVITFGNFDHNVTVGGGYGFVNSKGETNWQDNPIFVVNGMARVGRKFALVSENWVVPVQNDAFDRGYDYEHYETFFSYAMRFMGEKSTLDFGFVNTPALIENGWYIGIPYIDFVIRFGKYKDE
jgi:hypothetical protein